MGKQRYTNCMLTIIALALVSLVLQRFPLVASAVAQESQPQPMRVVIVGWDIPPHAAFPVAIADQTLRGNNPIPVIVK
jgi:hypothetical protein